MHFLFLSDQNPVLDISQQVLQNAANALGDSVAAFLASDEFTSVAPNGIQVLEVVHGCCSDDQDFHKERVDFLSAIYHLGDI